MIPDLREQIDFYADVTQTANATAQLMPAEQVRVDGVSERKATVRPERPRRTGSPRSWAARSDPRSADPATRDHVLAKNVSTS